MISIIILTFNSTKYIKSCLDSLFAQDYQDFEIIIVDNGSKDGTPHLIKENYPQVRLIQNKENLGACKGKNQGIDIAKGSWILTLDCDVILERNFLKNIAEFIKGKEERLGMVQPKILNIDKKTIYSCGIYLSKLRRFYDIGRDRVDNGQFNTSKYIFGACSAAALYNRQMLEEIKEDTGYFDERFFFLVEDVDLSWRAQRNGWKVIFYPKAVCYHFGNSSKTDNKLRQFLCFRNRYFTIKKNMSLMGRLKLFVLSFWYEICRFFYLLFTNRYIIRFTKGIND